MGWFYPLSCFGFSLGAGTHPSICKEPKIQGTGGGVASNPFKGFYIVLTSLVSAALHPAIDASLTLQEMGLQGWLRSLTPIRKVGYGDMLQ